MSPEKSQYGSLSEQARMVNIAAKYTGGDIEKARLMVAGQNNDAVAVKGKFSVISADKFGIFILFVNLPGKFLMSINDLVVGSRAGIEKARIFDHWKQYYTGFTEIAKREGVGAAGSYELSNHLANSMNGYNLYSGIEAGDLEGVTTALTEILIKYFGINDVECQVELEKTSSLAIELEGIPLEQAGEVLPEQKSPGADTAKGKFHDIESQADYIVDAKVIISPVRGKSIQTLRPGDSFKVQLLNKDEISMRVAEVLKAVTEEGDILPIKGRLKAKFPDTGGTVMYAYIAKNVLARIVEEENVRIEVDTPRGEEDADNSSSKLSLYVALLAGLILFTVLLLLAIF
jgi:hypothetical protein